LTVRRGYSESPLNRKTREVFKDANLVVLWLKIVKTKEPIPE
jgi:hypothetical protein